MENDIFILSEDGKELLGFKYLSSPFIKLPDGITSIGLEAFKGCDFIQSVVIPNSVNCIGHLAFENCTLLKDIDIPDSITEIKDQAFLGCSTLKNVEIPSNVYEIGNNCFENCVSLKGLHFRITEPDNINLYIQSFDEFNENLYHNCILFVPPGARWAYKHRTILRKFENIEIENS